MNLLDSCLSCIHCISVLFCDLLLLTLSSSITVTIWWEGTTFLGLYKGSKIMNFFWQCSCLIMSPVSPSYHDYIYMSSLVYGFMVYGSIHLLIPSILILPTALLILISVWSLISDHLSGLTESILMLKRREMQLTTTSTEHREILSLSLSPF